MENVVTRELVPEARRSDHVGQLFGLHFPMQLEPFIYSITEQLSADYKGGYWLFYALSNGGFYMAPDSEKTFAVSCQNCYQGVLSADALGIVVCLYAYSHLSFTPHEKLGRMYARHYHLLREHIFEHPEVSEILGQLIERASDELVSAPGNSSQLTTAIAAEGLNRSRAPGRSAVQLSPIGSVVLS